MKAPLDEHNWFFVDESGDPIFYNRHGELIVGREGCSPILMLGFIETTDPHTLRQSLLHLQQEITHEIYFQGVPSLEKTKIAFHAKDDLPEIRYRVYKHLATLDFRAQFVIARKSQHTFRNQFQGNQTMFYDSLITRLFQNALHRHQENSIVFAKRGSRDRQQPLRQAIQQAKERFEMRMFYDSLITRLFQNALHRHQENSIVFAKRGSRDRQQPLRQAIQQAKERFEMRWNTTIDTEIYIQAHRPRGEPCLSIIDYMNWAVYRAFTRGEMRFYETVAEKVSLLVDLYDYQNYPRNWYNRKNPFHINKITPL